MSELELLSSGLAPLVSPGLRTYDKAFADSFLKSQEIDLLVAFVSSDAVVELSALAKVHPALKKLNVTVGMASFDGLYESQLGALLELDTFLLSKKLGGVFIETALPVHAKLVYFLGDGFEGALLGSSNLSGLVSTFRQYEVDILIQAHPSVRQIRDIIENARTRTAVELLRAQTRLRVSGDPNVVLDGVPNVSRIDTSRVRLTQVSFDLPVKVAPQASKSNVNVHFGKPRKDPIPRPWYEVEIVVDKEIAMLPGYPVKGSKFDVITDDGWRFPCEIHGDNNKNFRSSGDLKTLGKWLKVRLQNAGALNVGELADESTLAIYGRDHLTFTQTEEPNVWFLDFSRLSTVSHVAP